MTYISRDEVLLGGFDDPVDDAQNTFRQVLEAMSSPGRVVRLDGPKEFPDGVSGPAASVLLSLTDFSTSLWVDPCLAHTGVQSYIGFHTGAVMARESNECAFALIAKNLDEIDLGRFSAGTAEYPDRSSTLIIEVNEFEAADPVRLTGPGIEKSALLGVTPLPSTFWSALSRNTSTYPLGIDVIFASPNAIVALPRSTRIEVSSCM